MIMADILYTPQLLIFDTIVHLTIVTAIVIMYWKTRELYSLSFQKGIKYLNNAMLCYLIGFFSKFVFSIFKIGLYFL